MSDSPGAATAYPTRVILLGVEQAPSYASLLSYADAGIEVVGISMEPVRRMRVSRHLRQHHRVKSDEETLRLLERLAPGGGTLIPCTHEFLALLAQHHESLSQHFRVTAPTWDILRPMSDQREAYAVAKELGVGTPPMFMPRDEADLRETVAALDVDNESYLLKTFWDTGPANPALNRYTLIAGATRDQILANCMTIFERNGTPPSIVQVIPGGAEHCYGVVMLVDHDHHPAFAYTIRRLKLYKSSHSGHPGAEFTVGANTFCETVDDPEAVDVATRLVERFRFTGPIVMEFRRDSRDGRLMLVKPDPRMTLATGLSRPLGIDLPLQTYRLFNNLPLAATPAVKAGVRWLWLAGYLDALWTERAHHPMHRELATTLRKAHRIRSLAFWDWRDPLPFVLDTGALFVKTLVESLRRR